MIDTNTITMGGDGKSHEIPDELWAIVDALVKGYREAKAEHLQKPEQAGVYNAWLEAIGKTEASK